MDKKIQEYSKRVQDLDNLKTRLAAYEMQTVVTREQARRAWVKEMQRTGRIKSEHAAPLLEVLGSVEGLVARRYEAGLPTIRPLADLVKRIIGGLPAGLITK